MTKADAPSVEYCERLFQIHESLGDGPIQIRAMLKAAQGDDEVALLDALNAMLRFVRRTNEFDAATPVLTYVRGGAFTCLGRCSSSAHLLCFHAIDNWMHCMAEELGWPLHSSGFELVDGTAGVDAGFLIQFVQTELSHGDWGDQPLEEAERLYMEMKWETLKAMYFGRIYPQEAPALLHIFGAPILPPTPRPQWNSRTGELRFGDLLCRKVNVALGRNIVQILNAFQELRWCDTIDCPLPGGVNAKKLKETIDSLNDNLTRIRFGQVQGGTRIRWYPNG